MRKTHKLNPVHLLTWTYIGNHLRGKRSRDQLGDCGCCQPTTQACSPQGHFRQRGPANCRSENACIRFVIATCNMDAFHPRMHTNLHTHVQLYTCAHAHTGLFILIFLVAMRSDIRHTYRLEGNRGHDCMATFCCLPCSVSQLARHVMHTHYEVSRCGPSLFTDPGQVVPLKLSAFESSFSLRPFSFDMPGGWCMIAAVWAQPGGAGILSL